MPLPKSEKSPLISASLPSTPSKTEVALKDTAESISTKASVPDDNKKSSKTAAIISDSKVDRQPEPKRRYSNSSPRRSWMDKLMDSLIGDDDVTGTSRKYALICSSCYTHNGLVLAHEYPNASMSAVNMCVLNDLEFLCFRCGAFNSKNDEPTFTANTTSSIRRASNPEVLLNCPENGNLLQGQTSQSQQQHLLKKRHTMHFDFSSGTTAGDETSNVKAASTDSLNALDSPRASTATFVEVKKTRGSDAGQEEEEDGYQGDESNLGSMVELDK